jgi:hypothetical protein
VILAAMFGAWVLGAAAAAVSTLAAAAPIIALGVAIGALAVLVKKAYDEHEGFRKVVDRVADFMKNTLWPALKDVGGWIRDTLIPIIADVATKLGEWIGKVINFSVDALSYLDDIYNGVSGFVQKLWDIGTSIFDALIWPYKQPYDTILPILQILGLVSGPGKTATTLSKGGSGGREFNPTIGTRGAKAMGGSVLAGGWYDVGERGRERVFLPQGASVQPAHARNGGGDTFNIYAPNAGPAEVAREIAWRRRLGDGR